MKTNILIFSAVLLLVNPLSSRSQNNAPLKGNITISGAFALYPMAVKWAEEFKKLNPGVQIDISAGGAGKGMTDALSGTADIGMISREINPEEIKKGAFPITVTKDAVIPTMSSKNPLFDFIMKKGVKRDAFSKLWITGQTKTWGQVLSVKATFPVHVYTRSDAAGAGETWAKYLGKKQEDLLGVGVFGDPGLATAVKKDPSGIGYNNIVYIYDATTKRQTNGVRVVPIDLNNNGVLDPEENFYDTIDDIIKAIADGKYPSPPARDLYFVTKGKTTNPLVVAFITYVLKEGQNFVHEAGYISIPKERIQGELNKFK
ncbi:MAG: substrate-binding domain-containing protein [Bacteroidota bacterium]